MKKISIILLVLATLLNACKSDEVKIRGKVDGLTGTVKLLAEQPGKSGMSIYAQQDVVGGDINLHTEILHLPARVWVDLAGVRTLEFIVGTKDKTWIEGKIQHPEGIEVKESELDAEYVKIKALLKEKYEKLDKSLDATIEKIRNKETPTKDDEVMLGIWELRKQRNVRYREKYVQSLIEANPTRELSLFLIQDELGDSTHIQKQLFDGLKIQNKESNVYQVLKQKLQ